MSRDSPGVACIGGASRRDDSRTYLLYTPYNLGSHAISIILRYRSRGRETFYSFASIARDPPCLLSEDCRDKSTLPPRDRENQGGRRVFYSVRFSSEQAWRMASRIKRSEWTWFTARARSYSYVTSFRFNLNILFLLCRPWAQTWFFPRSIDSIEDK